MPSLIGNKPNQVPSNGDLGTLAFQDANAVNITGGIVDVSAGTAALPSLGTTGDENTGVFFPAADTVAVSTNGTERMRITSTGQVGIGTSSPTEKLQVSGTILSKNTAGWSILGAEATDGTRSGASQYTPFGTQTSTNPVWFVGQRYDANGPLSFWRYNGSSHLANDMTLASGNLGLGVTPSAWSGAKVLDIGSRGTLADWASSQQTDIWSNGYFNGTNSIYKTTATASIYRQAVGQHQWFNAPSGTAGNAITFTQAMTLDASGNLGLGTTSPSTYLAKLAVSNNANSATTGISLVNNNGAEGNGSAINFYGAYGAPYSADNIYARINGAITSFNGSKLGNLIFSTGATNSISERMRITSAGVVELAQGQIKFPATQVASADANTLDDYEEGTWTVGFHDASTAGNASATTTTGYYTKIGNIVTISCAQVINISTAGLTAGNTFYISLPFAIGSSANAVGTIALGNLDVSGTCTLVFDARANATRASILQVIDAAGFADTPVSALSSGVSDLVGFSLTYRV